MNDENTLSADQFTVHSSTHDEGVRDDNACAAVVCRNPNRDIIDWIQCDTCMGWYHYLCVSISQRRAETMQTYKCPQCRKKRWQNQIEIQWRMTSSKDRMTEPLPFVDIRQLKMEQANDPALVTLRANQTVGCRVIDDIL